MTLIDTVTITLHFIVGGLWMGSALFFALAVLPTTCTGNIRAAVSESVISRLTMWSCGIPLVMFAAGGYPAGTRYIIDSLFGSGHGHLILGMLAPWFVLTGLVEVGRVRAKDGFAEKKTRTPIEKAVPFYFGATLVTVLLLVDAGLLLNWHRPRLPKTP